MNYLVTGGTGFIGSYIVRRLVREGHNVVCYDYLANHNAITQVMTPEEIAKVKIVQGDVTDQITLMHVCKDNNIEIIIHEAALLTDTAEANPALGVRTNVMGTVNVFETARLLGIKRVVFPSTQLVFGTPNQYPEKLIPNDAPHYPTRIYGKTKDFLEFLGEFYYERFGLECIGLRYCLVFGVARMRGIGQVTANLMNIPAVGERGVVDWGDDAPNFLYVEDAAYATVLASQCPNPKTRNFTICGEVKSIRALRDYVLTLLPDAEIEIVPGLQGSSWNFDPGPAERELGYKPQFSAEEGAKETINLARKAAGLPPVGV